MGPVLELLHRDLGGNVAIAARGNSSVSEYEKTTTPNIIVDNSSGVLLNTDMGAFEAIKRARLEKRKAAELADRVTVLENEMRELKEMIGKT